MKILTPKLKKSEIFSMLSLIVSISAVILTYYQNFQNNSEKLSIIIKPHINQAPIKITEWFDIEKKDKVIQIPWKLIISNTGSKKISIVDYSIINVQSTTSDQHNYKHGIYNGANGGIFNSNGKKLELPLTIDVGESRFFNVYVGILIDLKIFKILEQHFSNEPFYMGDAIKVLGAKNFDIYGNKAKLYEINGGEIHLWVDQTNRKSPLFMFEFISGNKNKFGTVASGL